MRQNPKNRKTRVTVAIETFKEKNKSLKKEVAIATIYNKNASIQFAHLNKTTQRIKI